MKIFTSLKRVIVLLCVLLPASLLAQTITGVVKSAKDNDPIENTTVRNTRTKKTALTNENGFFKLEAQPGDLIEISSSGYIKKTITAVAGINNVTLAVNAAQEKEVIVSAFGVKKDKRGASSASQTLDGESEIAVTQRDNWMNAIQGRVAGATVNATSGAPGASSQIVLRGFNSIGGDNSALIVVDGMIINNSVTNQGRMASELPNRNNDFTNRGADVNPEDIESMTILKGPEAAALYGVEAGNGAVIITTKRAKIQKLKFSYDNNFRLEHLARFHDVQKVYDNGTNGAVARTSRLFFGPRYQPGTVFYNNPRNFFDIGQSQSQNVTVEGGRGVTGIRFNTRYFDQFGTVPTTRNQRVNSRLTVSSRYKKFDIQTSVAYAYQFNSKTARGAGGFYQQLLTWPLDDDARNWRSVSGNRRILSRNTDGSDATGEANNPYFEINRNRNQDRNNRVTFTNTLKYNPFPWLNFSWTMGADAFSQYNMFSRDRESSDVFTVRGRVEELNTRFRSYTSNFLVTATKKIGKWSGKLMAGHGLDDRTTSLWGIRGDSLVRNTEDIKFRDINVNEFTSPNLRLNSRTQGRDTLILQRSIGLFFDASISYNELIYLNISGRNDWLAEFPAQNRSFFYPALGTSFIFSELFKKNKLLNFGKLRLSVAQTGKRVAPYANQSTVASTNGYGLAYGFGASNPDLFPEQQRTLETGVELKMFNNFLNLDLTYYKINIRNSVAANARPSFATGFILYTANIADLFNEGYEAVANFNWVKKKNVGWNTRLTFSKMFNRVTRLPLPEFYNSDSWLAGYRASLYRGLPTTTIGGQDYLRNNAGQILIDPGTGYPLIDQNYVKIGDRNPDFVMGITNNFNYKTFRLGFTLDWKQGGDVLNGTEQFLVQQGLSKRTLDREIIRIIPGVLNDGLQNSATPTPNTIPINPYYQSDYYQGRQLAVDFVERDVNWLRLRDITLAYAAGPKVLKKLRAFSKFEAFVTGADLFIISNYSGIDPSANGNTPATGGVGSFAIDFLNLPTPISVNFGIRCTFKQRR
jgi:TonB-linked SusC/RagA family outer membrane protein